MVKEFSDFARLPEAVKEENNVVQICQEAMIFQKQATPNITFSLVPSKKKIISVCDAGQVSQVLNNVLLNAIQAIEESKTGSEINIGIEDSEKSVKIIIEDDGPGLPEEDITRLTEPYVTTRKKGTGLGLAIVKKILDDHNGSIELDNSSELGGARVVMKIEK
jgi:two-component system nitrogen regulation sensor histidine kinase NtrY